jgi:hypothetical protein
MVGWTASQPQLSHPSRQLSARRLDFFPTVCNSLNSADADIRRVRSIWCAVNAVKMHPAGSDAFSKGETGSPVFRSFS